MRDSPLAGRLTKGDPVTYATTATNGPGPQHRGRAPKSIGLWGAPQSGKTTFLAALYVAVTRSVLDLNIVGADDKSTDFIIDSTRTLTDDQIFPPGTATDIDYSWIMHMSRQVPVVDRGRFGRTTVNHIDVRSQFNIDLRDAPGRLFASQTGGAAQPQQQAATGRLNLAGGGTATGGAATASTQMDMMDYLAGCDGLLLLIDPVSEQKRGDAHDYFQGTLLRIAQRVLSNTSGMDRLPHSVAVCITKFDHPDVYNFARLRGYRTYDEDDPYLFPHVHDDDAENFFLEFCRGSAASKADMLCSSLGKYFDRSRVKFFVSSSIGFYLGQAGRFRDADPQNAENQGGTIKIRSQIHPINTLEPLLWLGERIAAG